MTLPHPNKDQALVTFSGSGTTVLITPLPVVSHFRVIAIEQLGDNYVKSLEPYLPGEATMEIAAINRHVARSESEAPQGKLLHAMSALNRTMSREKVQQTLLAVTVEDYLGARLIVVLRNNADKPEKHHSLDLFFNSDEGPVQLNTLHTPIYIQSVELP